MSRNQFLHEDVNGHMEIYQGLVHDKQAL